MIISDKSPEKKRADFRKALNSGKLLQFPGAYNPMVAMLIQQTGFDGVYVSGAVMANSLGLPDIGMTTLTEVSQTASGIARVTDLPTIMDIDTGFGETMSVARTVKELTYLGLSGCHIEDQVNPKRCGHLDNKELVSISAMVQKVKAAADAKTDPNFLLIARTDARAAEGLDAAINRAKAYVDAGADMIFPEAMKDESDFEAFRKAIDVPLLANMTEFGKSRLLSKSELENLGYNLVIYPVTTQRLAMKAVEDGLNTIKKVGTQESILDNMQTRKRLYEVLHYEDYNAYDSSLYNFNL
ncbi:methylisocitrate lyase [Cryomorpha ignava]|uniref:Methylisocitrate lyase n=1 Tax=Cryomorpha ignava TaxID=101383 RepID=A0A7K3WSI4_9FLAO|nr:methylisocitrate lyase [Cryomorpha ignava]NEN24444.1 methylisocitrate lyase [Cryomorpha ignava]